MTFRITPSFEIGATEDGRWCLEFPEHIDRDRDHDPILDTEQLLELQLMLASLYAEVKGIQ